MAIDIPDARLIADGPNEVPIMKFTDAHRHMSI